MGIKEGEGGFRYRLRHGEYDGPTEGGGGLLGMMEFAMGDSGAARGLLRRIHRGQSQRSLRR